ncbi:Acetyl-CoA carboxylase [Gracilariopsis chorda]|uniref:Acetyl-CoA carboxylase n=1 Tax=Gracilariopsis chorda TaxID=448386 RepID=A0A2V3IKK2_9FLOR|nr:Acetyl-CoA carboxylase [Gracilariopsis chorda]|eukprot:PXF42607.1 Acetyl-CoA carboxylase [Gracilariopsis chorda]
MPPHGHVIACKVTAENPDERFQPTSGGIQELTFRNTPNVWGFSIVGTSGGVHEFADSQFGHLFAWGETRVSSRRSLVLALKELSIRGDIRTTMEYLIQRLEMSAFRENQITTAWLDSLIAEKVAAESPPTDLAVTIEAVCRAHVHFTDRAELSQSASSMDSYHHWANL